MRKTKKKNRKNIIVFYINMIVEDFVSNDCIILMPAISGMSCAHHLSEHPAKFDVTLIDAVDYCGGQAFSIPLDKEEHGASWLNQGVQGGSYIFHHTMTMFARQGYHADPVNLQVCVWFVE